MNQMEILAGDRPVTDSQTRALWILLAQLDYPLEGQR